MYKKAWQSCKPVAFLPLSLSLPLPSSLVKHPNSPRAGLLLRARGKFWRHLTVLFIPFLKMF